MKKKSDFMAFVLLALLSTPLSAAFGPMLAAANPTIGLTSSSTNVSGRISTNTTWTLANSPYIVVGDVIVEANVFLLIEPGVVVKFTNGTNLIIDGALVAQGNNTHKITFTSNATVADVGDWGSIRFRDTSIDRACTIDWATIEYASTGVRIDKSSPGICNSTIQNNNYGIEGSIGWPGNLSVSDSSILNNNYGISVGGSRALVSNCLIQGNTYGIGPGAADQTTIWECTVSENEYGISSSYSGLRVLGSNVSNNNHGIIAGGTAYISKTIISKNSGTGVAPIWYSMGNTTDYYSGRFSIWYSTISENQQNGVISRGYSYGPWNTLHFSNVHDNTPYDVYNLASFDYNADVNATSNWWGTTDSSEIDEHIYDYNDDYNLRRVYYTPFLDSPVTIPPIAHDIAITKVTASPTNVTAGNSVYINVTIMNEGEFYETFNVSAYYNSTLISTYTSSLDIGGSSSMMFYWYTWGIPSGNYTISAEASSVPGETDVIDNSLVDGHVTVVGPPPPPPQPPYAYFSYSPYYPSVDDSVAFDASSSWDPDGSIVDYIWNYGDNTTGSGKITTHIYDAPGTYGVILKVTDDDGLNGTNVQYITVLPPMLAHDVAVKGVKASPTRAIPGDPVTVSTTVENQGDFTETFTITVSYDGIVLATQSVTDLAAKANTTLNYVWDTAGVDVGEYIIKAEASIVAGEGDVGDNTFVDGKVKLAHRELSIKLTGEFDYLRMETVTIRFDALVSDAQTMELVSGAAVNIEIYDSAGNLWISAPMHETISSSGIYEWTSAGTIAQMRLLKGVYLVHADASFRGGPLAHDIVLFHIDPPAEGNSEALYYVAFTVASMVCITGLALKRRQITSKLRR